MPTSTATDAQHQQYVETAHAVLSSAVAAAARLDTTTLTDDVDELAEPEASWRRAVEEVAFRHADNALAQLWTRGWQPADAARLLTARSSRGTAAMLPALLAHEAAGYRDHPHADPDWLAQLDTAGVGRWKARKFTLETLACRLGQSVGEVLRGFVELLAVCRVLPEVPRLRPDPSCWDDAPRPAPAVEVRLLDRVRALLEKAESTEFPEEAEALTGKAQQIMSRYSIDSSMLDGDPAGGVPQAQRIGIDDPYARQKVGLLSAVGRANRCEVVYSPGFGFCTVFGMPQDLALVSLLHASLLLQATRGMLAAGTQRDRFGRVITRSFRTSFLAAYAARVGQRLREASASATSEAEHQYGSGLLPVLAERDDAVRRLAEELLPGVKTMRASTVSDGRGWRAGLDAANGADLGGGQRLRDGTRALER